MDCAKALVWWYGALYPLDRGQVWVEWRLGEDAMRFVRQ